MHARGRARVYAERQTYSARVNSDSDADTGISCACVHARARTRVRGVVSMVWCAVVPCRVLSLQRKRTRVRVWPTCTYACRCAHGCIPCTCMCACAFMRVRAFERSASLSALHPSMSGSLSQECGACVWTHRRTHGQWHRNCQSTHVCDHDCTRLRTRGLAFKCSLVTVTVQRRGISGPELGEHFHLLVDTHCACATPEACNPRTPQGRKIQDARLGFQVVVFGKFNARRYKLNEPYHMMELEWA